MTMSFIFLVLGDARRLQKQQGHCQCFGAECIINMCASKILKMPALSLLCSHWWSTICKNTWLLRSLQLCFLWRMVYFAIIIYVIYFLMLQGECFVPELFCTLVLLLSFKFSLVAQSGREHFDLRSQGGSWEIMDSADNTVLTILSKVLICFLLHFLQRKTDGCPEGREFVEG